MLSGLRSEQLRLISVQRRRLNQFYKQKDVNPYEVLGIPMTATQAEIKKAYHELSMKFHPDMNQGSKESQAKFTKLTNAYNMLSNVDERRRFDTSKTMTNDFSRGFTPHVRNSNITRAYIHSSRKIYNFEEYAKSHYPQRSDSYHAAKKRDELFSTTNEYERTTHASMAWNTALLIWGSTILIVLLFCSGKLRNS